MLDAAIAAHMVEVLGHGGHAQRVRDDDDRVLERNLPQRLQQRGFALEVQVVAGLVQDQHRGVAQEQLGQGQLAQLARRQARAAFAQHGLVALGQAADEAMRTRDLAGGHDLVVVGIGVDHAQPVHDGAAEPVHLLRQAAYPAAQFGARELGHVVFIDEDAPLRGLVEAGQQLGQGGLAGAVAPHDGVQPAGADLQRCLLQRHMAARVVEACLVQAQPALGPRQVHGVGHGLDGLLQHGLQAACGLVGLGQRAPVAGQLRDGAQRLARQQVHGHQAADAHPLRIDGNGAHGDHGNGEQRQQHGAGLACVFHLAVLAEALGQPAVIAVLPVLARGGVVAQHLQRGAGVADFGRAPVQHAGLGDFLHAAAAHLVGPPPGQHAHDEHGHQDHRQHGPGNDADDHQGQQGHGQVQQRGRQAPGHARAHGAHVAEQLQPLAGRALLQRGQRVAQHGMHQRLGDIAVDHGAGFAQGAGAPAAQPPFQAQEAQHAGHHGRERGRAAACNDAVVDLQQEDGWQQAQHTDGQGQPRGTAQLVSGPVEGLGDGSCKSPHRLRSRRHRRGLGQLAGKKVSDHVLMGLVNVFTKCKGARFPNTVASYIQSSISFIQSIMHVHLILMWIKADGGAGCY